MKPLTLLILLTIGLLLTAGCSALSGTLAVTSEPEDAAVYLDGEYRGNTPCMVREVQAGNHTLELRHERYPAWRTDLEMGMGEEVRVVADLAENLVPEVALSYEGPGKYAQGETVSITGYAVTGEGTVTLSVEQLDGERPFAPQSYLLPVDDEYLFEYRLPTDLMPGGRYLLSARLGTGEVENQTITVLTEGEVNIAVVREIARTYHQTHTYSNADFFVCADMAMDVWNMIETKGIEAKIAVGDVNQRGERLYEADHAWVLAETSPGKWTAVETTGGFLASGDENYYEGWFFETPRDFKEYIDLSKRYNAEVDKALALEDRYNRKVDEYNNEVEFLEYLIDSYNARYVGRSLTSDEYQTAQDTMKSIDDLEIEVAELRGEVEQLSREFDAAERGIEEIQVQMMRLVETIEYL
jgi:hypothetical protein